MNNEIFFNELCLRTDFKDYSVIENLKKCYFRLKEEGFSVCRIDYELKENLFNYLKGVYGISKKTITDFFYSFFREPFEKSDMTDGEIDNFLMHNIFYNNEQAIGLTWAYCFDTLAISLLTDSKWDCPNLVANDRADSDKIINIHHASTDKNINANQLWIESLKECKLLKTSTLPKDKRCSLRNDHGKDELQDFWNKMKNCEYVEECINSLPYNSDCHRFIKKIYPNGKIEIVLNWTDKGFGMVVQTTGRNIIETQKIADIISKKYSK